MSVALVLWHIRQLAVPTHQPIELATGRLTILNLRQEEVACRGRGKGQECLAFAAQQWLYRPLAALQPLHVEQSRREVVLRQRQDFADTEAMIEANPKH